MFRLILLCLTIGFASTAHLPNTYVPPKAGQGATYLTPGQEAGGNGNFRPQQAAERGAAVLKMDQEIGEKGFRYVYETSNGIQAEESGDASKTRGGFSYKGDDGYTYIVTFTAGVAGFQPQGAHLPVAPPTPPEILLALQQNARDEAAGIFDDGKYRGDISGRDGKSGGFGSANRQGRFNSNSGYSY